MSTSFSLWGNSTQHLLPAYSKPFGDELLSSWLARMSQDHGLNIYEFCKLCWPALPMFERDIDRNVKDEAINAIARRTNCSFEEVKSTSMRYYEGKVYDPSNKHSNSRTRWVLPIGRSSFKHKMKGLMFCPGCLQQDAGTPYYRKRWRLALSFACVDCGCYLYDCCPWCGSPVCFFRNSIGLPNQTSFKNWVTCSACKRDLRDSEIQAASPETIEIQRNLYSILDSGINSQIFYPIQYFDVLGQIVKMLISYRARLQSLRRELFEYHKVPYFVEQCNKPKIETLEYDKRIQVIKVGHWLLEAWPGRLLFYLKKHKLTSSDALSSFKDASLGYRDAPFWYEKVIREEIYHPRDMQTEVPFGLHSIFGVIRRQNDHRRRHIKL